MGGTARTTGRRGFLAASAAVAASALLGRRAAAETEEERTIDVAIVQALEYLSFEQQESGAWRATSFGDSTAATSLALMAFMAAGHVPEEGPYAEAIDRGIRYVLDHQLPNGLLVHKSGHGPMYDHGIATLMLAEIIGMVKEPLATSVRRSLEDAVKLILRAQNVAKPADQAGGWRYQPTSQDSDLSVTGWQLLALRAAKNDGCDVPAEQIDRAVAYVKKCSVAGDRGFAYQPNNGPTATRTGTGITCLEICGEHHAEESIGGADYLRRNPLTLQEHFFYYGAYYCSVGLFKVGGRYWDEAKPYLSQLLLAQQEFDGRWNARGGERAAGDVYATAMAVLALSIEYQYLPIYQR